MVRIVLDLDELEQALGDKVTDFIVDLANAITNEMKAEAPVGATGDLRRSIQSFRTSDNRVVLGTRLGYAEYVATGTRPHTPPFEPIQTWARRVLGNEAAAGAVWHKIRTEGTDPNDYIGRGVRQGIEQATS